MTIEVTPRRERVRAETTAEIKARAWTLLADGGVDALSLRKLARQMGMAPSAIYRYFVGRDDLLTSLIVDGFTGLADAVESTHERAKSAGADAFATWLAVADAYRRWAREDPTAFALVYSNSAPGYQGTAETTAAAARVGRALLAVMVDLLADGVLDTDAITAEIDGPLAGQLADWSAHGGLALPPAALAAAMRCYAMLHGLVHLEVNNHYPPPLQGSDALFNSTIRALTESFAKPALPDGERTAPKRQSQPG